MGFQVGMLCTCCWWKASVLLSDLTLKVSSVAQVWDLKHQKPTVLKKITWHCSYEVLLPQNTMFGLSEGWTARKLFRRVLMLEGEQIFQGLFLEVLLLLVRSWTRHKWFVTLSQFLVSSHLFNSQASHENLPPFDFYPSELCWLLDLIHKVLIFFFPSLKDHKWKAIFIKNASVSTLKCLKLKV